MAKDIGLLAVRGFSLDMHLRIFAPIGVLVLLAFSIILIGRTTPAFYLSVMAILFLAFIGTSVWYYRSAERTFPVALTESGIIIERQSGRHEVSWSQVTGLTEQLYTVTRFTCGFNLILSYKHNGKPREICIGTMRASDSIWPMILSAPLIPRRVHITEQYDAIIAYARAKGVAVDAPTTRVDLSIPYPHRSKTDLSRFKDDLASVFMHARAKGLVKIVRR